MFLPLTGEVIANSFSTDNARKERDESETIVRVYVSFIFIILFITIIYIIKM